MSLGGIAIAIGAMVDAAIIMVENAHKALEHFRDEHGREPEQRASASSMIIAAAKTVGRPLFFSLLVITVSFIPVFSLTAQEGRLFKPLAFTKTFSMFFAALLGITLVPVLMALLIRGKITPETKNPVNRFLIWAYQPFVNFVLRFRWLTLIWRAARARRSRFFPFCKARQGIHAAAERRNAPLHAHGGAGHVDHRSDEDPANPGSAAQKNSRSRHASSARPGKPKRRPIPRRSRCSRRSSRSSRRPMAARHDVGQS